jgi:hypothetical protein
MTGKKRFLMEQLVGSALESLAVDNGFSVFSHTQVEPEILAEFQQHLEELISERPSKIDFTMEKFIIYDIIQHIFSDDGEGSGRLISLKSENNKIMEEFLVACGIADANGLSKSYL